MPSGSITSRVVFHTRRRYSAVSIPAVCWNGREATRRFTQDIGRDPAASALAPLIRFRIEQPVQVHDEIAHMGVIDRLLRLRFPSDISGGVVGINSDDIQLVDIPELDTVQISEFAAEDEMQQLCALRLVRHDLKSLAIPLDPDRSVTRTRRADRE